MHKKIKNAHPVKFFRWQDALGEASLGIGSYLVAIVFSLGNSWATDCDVHYNHKRNRCADETISYHQGYHQSQAYGVDAATMGIRKD